MAAEKSVAGLGELSPNRLPLTEVVENRGNLEPNNESLTFDQGAQPTKEYLQGWKLHALTAGVWLSLFLSTLETTIISTSLVSITNAVDGFMLRDWVVTSYLLTYTGFQVILAKFSDIFGRKTILLLSLALFTLFSILCGASEGITELIIFRAFQGIGASGIYSIIMALAPTLVPEEQFGKYIAIISTVFLLASILGPILGGAISAHSSWRWVFLLNAPAGCFSMLLIASFLPSSIPSKEIKLIPHLRGKFTKSKLQRIDVLGTILLLAFSILLVFALEEAGSRYSWTNPAIIATFVLGGISGVLFMFWEWFVEHSTSKQEPTFPLTLLKDRVFSGMMATAFFIGFPFVAIVVNIPQRAQAVYGSTPLRAGLVLLPLLLTSPLATALSGYLTSNRKLPPVYLIIAGAALQVVGVALTCTLPTDAFHIPPQLYGFEVLMGIGFGLGLSTLLTLARLVVVETNLPVTMGALTQVRVLGGTISLAICSTMLNNHLRSRISSIVSKEEMTSISDSLFAIASLDPEQQTAIRTAFAEGYNRQNVFLAALTGVGFITSLFILEKTPRRLK